MWVAALAAVVVLGCSQAAGGGDSAGGSVGVSRDDALVYAADSDLDVLFVMDARTLAVQEIAVGRQPEKVLVGPDDTVFVTNRLGRSVSVIRKGDSQESARLAVGVEPVSLATSSDGRTLYVVNATSLTDSDFGTLMAFDTSTLSLKWELPVGREPRALTLMSDDKAAIALAGPGDLVLADLAAAKLLKTGTGLFDALNASALGITTVTPGSATTAPPFDPRFAKTTSHPLGFEAMTVSREGQLYVTSQLATDATLQSPPADAGSFPGSAIDTYGAGGSAGGGARRSSPTSCSATSVTAPALLTFDKDANPLVDDLATCEGTNQDDRPSMMLFGASGQSLQGPRALALDSGGLFLFIVNQQTNNVAIVPTGKSAKKPAVGSTRLVTVGAGPSGIAMSRDGKTAWVYNAFDHSLSKLQSAGGTVVNSSTIRLTSRESLTAMAAAGRKLFFTATDARMSNASIGISCASCHFEGREDGHVWNFSDGPRQTPSLQSRMLAETAPFHWNGEFSDLVASMSHTVTDRMGGQGLSRGMEQQIAAFIEAMPKADNPHAGGGTAADVRQRGEAAFNKAACGTCHSGAAFTNNGFANVGTFVQSGQVKDDVPALLVRGGLNTPSLLGLARTAPFLHDGSALTLKGRLMTGKNGDRHGQTSQLTDAEVDDLVAYLKSL